MPRVNKKRGISLHTSRKAKGSMQDKCLSVSAGEPIKEKTEEKTDPRFQALV